MRQGWIVLDGGAAAYVRQQAQKNFRVRRLDTKSKDTCSPISIWPIEDGWLTMCNSSIEAEQLLQELVAKRNADLFLRRARFNRDGLSEDVTSAENKAMRARAAANKIYADYEEAVRLVESAEAICSTVRPWTEAMKALQDMESGS